MTDKIPLEMKQAKKIREAVQLRGKNTRSPAAFVMAWSDVGSLRPSEKRQLIIHALNPCDDQEITSFYPQTSSAEIQKKGRKHSTMSSFCPFVTGV